MAASNNLVLGLLLRRGVTNVPQQRRLLCRPMARGPETHHISLIRLCRSPGCCQKGLASARPPGIHNKYTFGENGGRIGPRGMSGATASNTPTKHRKWRFPWEIQFFYHRPMIRCPF